MWRKWMLVCVWLSVCEEYARFSNAVDEETGFVEIQQYMICERWDVEVVENCNYFDWVQEVSHDELRNHWSQGCTAYFIMAKEFIKFL